MRWARESIKKPIIASYSTWLLMVDPMHTPFEWTNVCEGVKMVEVDEARFLEK